MMQNTKWMRLLAIKTFYQSLAKLKQIFKFMSEEFLYSKNIVIFCIHLKSNLPFSSIGVY